jgi:hypothetical protein
VSPGWRKKPARPKSQAAKQRARRARRAASKKLAPKVAPKRTAKRDSRAARKAAAAERAVKPATAAKSGTKPATPAKRAAKPAPTKVAIRRTGVRTPGRAAELKVVLTAQPKKRAKKLGAPKPRPFAGALENASAKDLAIFDLVRARVEVQAAIQGLQPGTAERPVDAGKWSPRQIVLHLHYWDREMLPYVERAWRHDERPPHTKDQILTENGSFLGELDHHEWDEARRLMQHSREQFLEELQSVPEEPAEMWSSEHALGWLIRILSHHDRHHAAVLKDARSRAPANATESP